MRRLTMLKRVTLLAAVFTLPSFNLVADQYHYKNIINGAKAAGLGGAYIAVADDLTAMLYNPAGLSFSTVDSTASMNVLSWEKTEFSNVFSDDSDFVRDSFAVVPGFFAFRAKRGQWDFGLSFAVTDYSKERTSKDVVIESPSLVENQYIFIDLDNSAYQFGGSLSYKASEQLSFGASLYVQYQEFISLQGSGIASKLTLPDNSQVDLGFNASRRISDTHVTLQPILGVLWQQDNLSLGAKFSYNFDLRRDYDVISTIYVASSGALPDTIQPISRITAGSESKQKFPYEIGIGAAYKMGKFTLSADVNYFSKVSSDNERVPEVETPITRTIEATVNWAVGVEYQLSATSAIRFGLFTDNANSKVDPNIDFQRIEAIDHIGLSTSLKTSVFDKQLTVGMYYKYGTGQVRFADIRAVENIVGIPLYPDNGTNDTADATKQTAVMFLSLDF